MPIKNFYVISIGLNDPHFEFTSWISKLFFERYEPSTSEKGIEHPNVAWNVSFWK